MTQQIHDELREILFTYHRDPAWKTLPDHIVLHYVKGYLANKLCKGTKWYKELEAVMVDYILLEETKGG